MFDPTRDVKDNVLKKAEKGRKKMGPFKKLALVSGAAATIFASGLYVENRFDVLGEGGMIDEMFTIEPYSGGWEKEYIDSSPFPWMSREEYARKRMSGVADELSGLPEGDYGYWEGAITKKNPDGLNWDEEFNRWYIWIPKDYKGK